MLINVSPHRLADAWIAHEAASSHPGYQRPRVAAPDIRDTQWMPIPDDQIDDFIARWQSAFNETLTRDQARTRAFQLVELFKVIGERPPINEPTPPPTAKEIATDSAVGGATVEAAQ